MLTGCRLLAAAVVAAMAGLGVTTTASAEDHPGETEVGNCDSGYVCSGVSVPGEVGESDLGGKQPVGRSRSDSKATGCAAGAKKDPETGAACKIDGIGTLDPGTLCYYTPYEPPPPPDHPLWEGHKPGDGAIYLRNCLVQNPDGTWSVTSNAAWRADPPGGAAGPTPEQLAQQALSRMRLDGAQIGSAPPAGSKGLVGMPVWLWTNKTANTWGPISATATAGGLSVTATAHVQKITWNMGDGHSVVCTKPGTPYKQSYGKKDSPDCGYRYAKVSNGRYTITATSTWAVEWEASTGETGALADQTRTAQTTARIGELQVVN